MRESGRRFVFLILSLFMLALTPGMTRTAWGVSVVSNVRSGYPGPQPGFRYDDPAYSAVIPYIERLR